MNMESEGPLMSLQLFEFQCVQIEYYVHIWEVGNPTIFLFSGARLRGIFSPNANGKSKS